MSKSGVNEELLKAIKKRDLENVCHIFKKNSLFKKTLMSSPYLTHYAVLHRSNGILQHLLEKEHMNPNLRIEKNQMRVKKYLPGVDVVDGDTCLHIASRLGDLSLVSILLRHKGIDVTIRNKRDETSYDIIPDTENPKKLKIVGVHLLTQTRLQIKCATMMKVVGRIDRLHSENVKLREKVLEYRRVFGSGRGSSPGGGKKSKSREPRLRSQSRTDLQEKNSNLSNSIRKKREEKEIPENSQNLEERKAEEQTLSISEIIGGGLQVVKPGKRTKTKSRNDSQSPRAPSDKKKKKKRRTKKEILRTEDEIRNLYSEERKKLGDLTKEGKKFVTALVTLLNPEERMEKLKEKSKLEACHVDLLHAQQIFETGEEIVKSEGFRDLCKLFWDLFQQKKEWKDGEEPKVLNEEDINKYKLEVQEALKNDIQRKLNDVKIDAVWGQFSEKYNLASKDFSDMKKVLNNIDQFETELEFEEDEDSDDSDDSDDQEVQYAREQNRQNLEESKRQLGGLSLKCFVVKRELESLKSQVLHLSFCYDKRRFDILHKMNKKLMRLDHVLLAKDNVNGKKNQMILKKYEKKGILVLYRTENDYEKLRLKKQMRVQEVRMDGLKGEWIGVKKTTLFHLDDEMEMIEKQMEEVDKFVEEKREEVHCLFKFVFLRDEYLGIEMKDVGGQWKKFEG